MGRMPLAVCVLLAAAVVGGCGESGPAVDGREQTNATAAAERAVRDEYPHDTFEVVQARRMEDGAAERRWLVEFRFANDEGSACVLVGPERIGGRSTKLVECAFYSS